MIATGYEGGIGYANGSTCTPPSSCNITRNATGYLQVRQTSRHSKHRTFVMVRFVFIYFYSHSTPHQKRSRFRALIAIKVDPEKFPGGNKGFAEMVDEIRAMGFKWGSYTEVGYRWVLNGDHTPRSGIRVWTHVRSQAV